MERKKETKFTKNHILYNSFLASFASSSSRLTPPPLLVLLPLLLLLLLPLLLSLCLLLLIPGKERFADLVLVGLTPVVHEFTELVIVELVVPGKVKSLESSVHLLHTQVPTKLLELLLQFVKQNCIAPAPRLSKCLLVMFVFVCDVFE